MAKNRKYIFLGYPISVDGPNSPAIPAPEMTTLYSLAQGNKANVSVVKVANHTGTHVDAPAHVIEGGLRITEFEPEEFIFNHPAGVDLRLGYGEIVESDHLLPVVDVAKNADLVL